MSGPPWDVAVVGGGVAGLTAAMFTARAGLSTRVFEHGGSILKRNAHLENFPGYPAGVNARLFLELLEEQAVRSGADLRRAEVNFVRRTEDGFHLELDDEVVRSRRVVAACWPNTDPLQPLDLRYDEAGSKRFVRCDEVGSTPVEGLYVAGRLAGREHQAIVAAGHGAEVGLTVVRQVDPDYYHDWVTPQGYFTDRGRTVPPGCEEIPAEERRRREGRSRRILRRAFERPYGKAPRRHPGQRNSEPG